MSARRNLRQRLTNSASIAEILEIRIFPVVTASWTASSGVLYVSSPSSDVPSSIEVTASGPGSLVKIRVNSVQQPIVGGPVYASDVTEIKVLNSANAGIGINTVNLLGVTSANGFTSITTVKVTGSTIQDSVKGSPDYANEIRGIDGDDTIWGGSKGDTLAGYRGDDVIRGEGGNDFIYGYRRGSVRQWRQGQAVRWS